RNIEAEALLTEGLAMLAGDTRARIPGEEALWHYKRAVARVALRRREDALADLDAAMVPGSMPWVQGRAHVELARLAEQRNDAATVRREADTAIDVCGKAGDPICVTEAKKLR